MSKNIVQYLESIGSLRGNRARPDGHAYDSMDHFLLTNAQAFKPIPRPKEFRKLAPKACYANCFLAVSMQPDKLVYCEGMALGVIPVQHAWVCRHDSDEAIDITWDEPGSEYFGVKFSLSYLLQHWGKDEVENASLIDHWEEHWPLLKTETTGWKYVGREERPKTFKIGGLR